MSLCQFCFFRLHPDLSSSLLLFFFFNDTATTEIYTLSLHDALPIFGFSDCLCQNLFYRFLYCFFRLYFLVAVYCLDLLRLCCLFCCFLVVGFLFSSFWLKHSYSAFLYHVDYFVTHFYMPRQQLHNFYPT